ncbi:MAG: GNAT family N-acetyltransferase [Solirubrobacteraceae bacterium]
MAIADRPASLALIGRRGKEAWVGGMATAPAYRRRGLGEQALVAAIEAAGCPTVWLEVLQGNGPAIALYEKLGFERVRELIVWTLDAPGTVTWRPAKPDRAHAWIAAHRTVREPWQRADQSLRQIEALVIERDGEVAGAALYRDRAGVRIIMQAAALDDDAARDTLLAARGGVRFANVPSDDRFAHALEQLGARREASQFELRLTLPPVS